MVRASRPTNRSSHLGERLALPPFLEPRRASIEAGLKPLETPDRLKEQRCISSKGPVSSRPRERSSSALAPDRRTRIRVARWGADPDTGCPWDGADLHRAAASSSRNTSTSSAICWAVASRWWCSTGAARACRRAALRNRRKGHVDDFGEYGRGSRRGGREGASSRFCPRPFFALAHSMGGAVWPIHAGDRGRAFERIVLSAPMVEVHNLPFPRHLAPMTGGLVAARLRRLLRAAGPAGGGVRPRLRGQRADVRPDAFRRHDVFRPGRPRTGARRTDDRLAVCGLPRHAAARATSTSAGDPDTPMLVVVPGGRSRRSVSAMERFAQRLKAGPLVRIPHARHEILMERDSPCATSSGPRSTRSCRARPPWLPMLQRENAA